KADPTSALGHYCLGTALWYEGRWKESLAAYERTVELAPEDPDPYYSLGNNQRRLNRPDEAIDSYTTARKLGLRSAGLLYELGLALKEKGRIEEAIDTWREALRIEANLAKAHTALAWCLATAADPRLRDPKAALAHAKK